MSLEPLEFFYSPDIRQEFSSLLFLDIYIHGHALRALVDTGASCTFLGREAIHLINLLAIPIVDHRSGQVKTATGQIESSSGCVALPIELRGESRVITARFLPSLALPCVLGLDFLRCFAINIDFNTSRWTFAKYPLVEFSFEKEKPLADDTIATCYGLRALTDDQSVRLREFLGREPRPVASLRRNLEASVEIERQPPDNWAIRMRRLTLMHDWVTGNLGEAFRRQSRWYNLHRRSRTFSVGDLVLKRQHVMSSASRHVASKLATKFHGPFRVRRVVSSVVVELEELTGKDTGRVHVKDLKPYYATS